MTQHTQEPWTTTDIGTIHGKDSQFIAELGGMRAEADLRRIAACINACAGIPTEALEGTDGEGFRNVLVQARESLGDLIGRCKINGEGDLPSVALARTVLAKLRGET